MRKLITLVAQFVVLACGQEAMALAKRGISLCMRHVRTQRATYLGANALAWSPRYRPDFDRPTGSPRNLRSRAAWLAGALLRGPLAACGTGLTRSTGSPRRLLPCGARPVQPASGRGTSA